MTGTLPHLTSPYKGEEGIKSFAMESIMTIRTQNWIPAYNRGDDGFHLVGPQFRLSHSRTRKMDSRVLGSISNFAIGAARMTEPFGKAKPWAFFLAL